MTAFPRLSRRTVLRGAAGAGLAAPLFGLASRRAAAIGVEPVGSPYGPVAPVKDQTTGLYLLQLPEGFRYQSFGWTGDLMADGKPTPFEHDGMAVVRSRLVGGETELTLIRNHESVVQPAAGLIGAPARYDTATITDEDGLTGQIAGGNTLLVYRGGAWVSSAPALGGTINNCAGGPSLWNSWLTCEEDRTDFTEAGGKPHGYVFDVSHDPTQTTGNPIVAMGRFDHEAVAFDPATGNVYLTEDDRNQSGLYRFLPNDTSRAYGALEQGGTLQMAKVAGTDRADLNDPQLGQTFTLEWVTIEDPDLDSQPYTEQPHDADNVASGPFVQGRELGGARFSRGEGIWYSAADRLIYFVDTAAGRDADGAAGRGTGAVWALDPATDRLTCIFASSDALAANNPDNLTVSPRGGILLCEDGGGVEDAFGFGERLLGLTPSGETYIFAKNNIMLEPGQILAAGKSASFIEAGDFRDKEWCGACFDPAGQVLFVNIQTPGITFAISGPFERGFL